MVRICRFADEGVGFGQQFVQRAAIGNLLLEGCRFRPHLIVGELFNRGFKGIYFFNSDPVARQCALNWVADDLLDYILEHTSLIAGKRFVYELANYITELSTSR